MAINAHGDMVGQVTAAFHTFRCDLHGDLLQGNIGKCKTDVKYDDDYKKDQGCQQATQYPCPSFFHRINIISMFLSTKMEKN